MITNYIRIIRPVNLAIVALCQCLVYFYVIMPVFNASAQSPTLSSELFAVFIIATLCISASGYIINDIFDHNIDVVNKPTNTFIGTSLTLKQAKMYYALVVLSGFIISAFIAYRIARIPLLIIYPLAIGLLFFYSKSLKKSGLWGNMVVALFTALVPCILLVPDLALYLRDYTLLYNAAFPVLAFGSFSYLINLIREIIKDIEDKEGDALIASKSIPLTQGVPQAKFLICFHIIVLIAFVISWQYLKQSGIFSWVYTLIALILPSLSLLYSVIRANKKEDYKWLSLLCKLIMLAGLVYLLILQ